MVDGMVGVKVAGGSGSRWVSHSIPQVGVCG